MYGFHKITSVENGGLRYDKDEIEFSHPCFMKGNAYLLEHIKRKIANPKAVITSSDSGEKLLFKPEVMSKVLADVKQMKGKQESLDAKFSAMKQENEALWREVAILRQKHIKQQQIVNNLIQFLMSLVQPSRSGNPNPNGVGVKRPYQLMINSAAHNSSNEQTYSHIKNLKLDKDAGAGDDLNDDNLEDGPTIHELAHDDNLQSELSPDHMNSSEFVTVQMSTSPYGNASSAHSPINVGSQVYHVTLDDGDELETDHMGESNVTNQKIGTRPRKNTLETKPRVISQTVRLGNPNFNEVTKKNVAVPSTSKTKIKVNRPTQNVTSKNLLSPSNFNVITPSADFKLPAEIFASDDSVSDAGAVVADDAVAQILETTTSSMPTLAVDPSLFSNSKDKMLGGINIKVERLNEPTPASQNRKTKSKYKDDQSTLNLQDIKTELQDDLDWNMSLATVNNYSDVNKFQTMNREDYYSKNYDGLPSHLGTNMPKNDIDDHLDTMQTDLESLRELLRSDTYALDANTLLGVRIV
ncbi:Heat shock factor protein [Eumeta japonica]|uniref:Heat shock factor protein n=1 Tax=Eumeta variegata TaxID=151549 RepID=A0A4C1ZEI2_EUMVA|nr:Heat shock factor protein [Eumeta japonica]